MYNEKHYYKRDEKMNHEKNTKNTMKQIIMIIIAILMLSGISNAVVYDISNHVISIDLDGLGNAKIEERYYLNFPNTYQIEEFRQKSNQLGIDLDAWKEFDQRIQPSIGTISDLIKGNITFTEKENIYLQLSYEIKEPITQKLNETSRITEHLVKTTKYFQNFNNGDIWIIPENTTLLFKIPLNSKIDDSIKPTPKTYMNEGKQIIEYTGYISSNELTIKYTFWKQIAPTLNIQQFFQEIQNSGIGMILIVIILILLGIGYMKREIITEKIENYIIEHSELNEEIEEKE